MSQVIARYAETPWDPPQSEPRRRRLTGKEREFIRNGYMTRQHLNLRQIEAFKAVIENGTVSRAAEALFVSQPAMSKLIANLEFDTGLQLFDRVKGRLVPTDQAMRLHEQVERIFAGVRQVENAVAAIKREEEGTLAIGVLAPLGGAFIQEATMRFLRDRGGVFCSVEMLSAQRTVERLIARTLDIGLVSGAFDNPYVAFEPLMAHPLVCILPHSHPLARKPIISSADLDGLPFVGFHQNTYFSGLIHRSLDEFGVAPRYVLAADVSPTLCEFVAAGLGVSLVHPFMASGFEHRLEIRRFEPEIPYTFQLARSPDSRNVKLIDGFVESVRETARRLTAAVLDGP